METNNDLISEWVKNMKELKWKYAITHPNFSSNLIDDIAATFKEFFPRSFYTLLISNQVILQKNWLINYLTSKNPNFIGFALELSKIIKFYHDASKSTGFFLNIEKISGDELRNRLFELSVAHIFKQNNVKVNLVDKYYLNNNDGVSEKPLDGSFIFKDQKYIIECQKVYDSKATSLIKSVSSIIQHILINEDGSLKWSYQDSLPVGYVFINDTSDLKKLTSRLSKDFKKCFDDYLNGLNEKTTLLIPKKTLSSKEYDILIEMSIFGNLLQYKELASKQKLSILFNIQQLDYKTGECRLSIDAQHKFTESDITTRLRRLIEEKKKQHNETDLPKIIFLDLEEDLPSPDNISQYFNLEELNHDRIYSIIREGISVCLVSRRYSNMETIYNFKFYSAPDLDNDLRNIIENLKY